MEGLAAFTAMDQTIKVETGFIFLVHGDFKIEGASVLLGTLKTFCWKFFKKGVLWDQPKSL